METSTAPTPKPALLTIDDDPGVARAVQQDLRRRYGDRCIEAWTRLRRQLVDVERAALVELRDEGRTS